MTERELWQFLERSWQRKGRAAQISGMIDMPDDPQLQAQGEYIMSHTVLPNDYDKMPKEIIIKMGNLLFYREIKQKTKEAIMVILAHQKRKEALDILQRYNKMPDSGLEVFAEMALDECAGWNNGSERIGLWNII